MKLHTPASKVAAAGRNGDSLLMHVSPSEVHALAGLGALTGRPLTTNPHTGMPEAFSLGDLIPYVAPIAAGMMFGPMGAAAASGLSTYATTGDTNKALMSGLTGAALGSMMGGVGGGAGAGTDAATQAGTTGATQGAGNAAINSSLDSTAIPGVVDYTSAAATGVPAQASSAGISGLSAVPAQAPSTWSQKLDALQNAKWTGPNSMLQNADSSYKMAPIIAAGGMLGLSGLSSNQAMSDQYAKQQSAAQADSDKRFKYYQSMAGRMPANMIPAYPG